jgi:hypothetical protein
MKKQSPADARIQSLLDTLKADYTTTEFRQFDSAVYRELFSVGAAYLGVLKDLKAVQAKRGALKLNEKFYKLRPSTVRKHMTMKVYESIGRPVTQTKKTKEADIFVKAKEEAKKELIKLIKSY